MTAYFWVNPNIDIFEKLEELKENLSSQADQKKRKLKSKQGYLTSQTKQTDDSL
jgi:hypothetical protein